MWVLHLHSGNATNGVRTIVEQKNCLCKQAKLNQLHELIDELDKYNLIIVDTESMLEDFEITMTKITDQSRDRIPIVIISDTLDFKFTSHLFDRGVMTIMSKSKFEKERFSTYLDTVIHDAQTLETLKDMKIAVVDDSNLSLTIIKGYFQRIGIENVSYYQSSEGIIDTALDYDLFLIDFLMPVVNGEELIYKIRQGNNDAIIILITAYGEGKTVSHCLSIGANDFLIKPFNFKLFSLRILAAVNQYRLNNENRKNSALLYQLATRDALTGVYNRAFFIETLEKRVSESNRDQSPLSLILLDLDHFKDINDEYGHQKGDEVLKATANLLVKHTRESDIVCRWGGEEFCIILSNCEIGDAIIIAEKMRSFVAQMEFVAIRPVSASFGVTSWQPEDTEDRIFKRLDNSLYLAKLTGRNKVVCNEELVFSDINRPVSVEWGPFFRSGNSSIDCEHQKLISLSNEITASGLEKDHHARTISLFHILIDDTVNHFRHEEEILDSAGYDKLSEHKEIHKSLINKTLKMYNMLMNGSITPIQVAKYVMQDVIIGHIIKSDFDYYEKLHG